MLIDPRFTQADDTEALIHKLVAGDRGTTPTRHGLGLYQIGHWNFDSLLTGKWERYTNLEDLYEGGTAYGVCDSPEQFMRKLGWKLADDRRRSFVISFVQLKKANESPGGGWRWHKWGPYIGEQDPQCEYLYDEPVIEEVWTYHVYEKTS